MNILQHDIPGSSVLDLFAGSGALGLEALSRGAEHSAFVENDWRALRVLKKKIDAFRLAAGLGKHAYDIAFADPPYAGGAAARIAGLWLEQPFARILSVEHDARERLAGSTDTRRYGSSAITFYRSED
jgi:16S rRNA (guanine966-N2)-methyltransferase